MFPHNKMTIFREGQTTVRFRKAAAGFVATGLLAGCASSAPSSLVPSPVTQTRAQAPAGVGGAAARANGGRVLYIANIDGQPGVGEILVYNASMKHPQLMRSITSGTGRPFGLWVDSKNDLWAANQTDKYPASVTAFKPGASSPFFTISSFKGEPQSVAVDAKGDVFVNESYEDEGFVQEFAPGSTIAERTIDTGVGGYAFTPGSMAFDPKGDLIVAEQAKLVLQLVEIVPGSSTVTPLNLDLGNSINGPGMGIDRAGNIYVASSTGASVSIFAPGQTEPSRTISNVPSYGLTAVTPDGALYQASGEYTVTEIGPGSSAPTLSLGCECSAQGVAVSR
jgi:hypothetical protein